MPITGIAALQNARTAFKTFAEEIFGRDLPGVWARYCESIPTDTDRIEHDVIEAFPVIRKWEGEKQFKSAQAATQSIRVYPYEASFEEDRLKVQADRTGQVGRRIQQFLANTAYAMDKLAHEALVANPTGYDGVALYSASHPRGPAGAPQSNTTTSALSFATFEAAMVAGASLRDANGEPLGVSYNLLRVGPKLAALAREITGSNERIVSIDNAGAIDSGTRVAATSIPNVRGLQVFTGGSVDVIVDPRLVGTYDDYWYLFDTNRGAPALVAYVFRAFEGISQDEMTDDGRFLSDKLRFSVEGDVGFGAGAWQTTYAGIVA